jgi:hypothetical protein
MDFHSNPYSWEYDVIHADIGFPGFKANRTSNANSLQNKDLQRTDEIETTENAQLSDFHIQPER